MISTSLEVHITTLICSKWIHITGLGCYIKCPSTEEWLKMWYAYTMEYYPTIKKNEIIPYAATWVYISDREWGHTEWSQMKRNSIRYPLYEKSRKEMAQTHLFTKQKQTHKLREQIDGYQGEMVGRRDS